jgi:murein tripeptide amidase MpaA
VRFVRPDDTGGTPQLFFEHVVEVEGDSLFFAFTYPYTYSNLQHDLQSTVDSHVNHLEEPSSIYCVRELVTRSCDGRRIDLITITSPYGHSNESEPMLSGLFPPPIQGDPEFTLNSKIQTESTSTTRRSLNFPGKEVVFVSARVHAGEVPASHTWKGILNLLMDPHDLRAVELRRRYVFKMIPMLNPDGKKEGSLLYTGKS